MHSQRHSLKFKNFNIDNKEDSQNTLSSNNSSQSEENDVKQRASKVNAAEIDASLRSLLNEENYTNMMKECSRELQKSKPNRSHIKTLLKKTFCSRWKELE